MDSGISSRGILCFDENFFLLFRKHLPIHLMRPTERKKERIMHFLSLTNAIPTIPSSQRDHPKRILEFDTQVSWKPWKARFFWMTLLFPLFSLFPFLSIRGTNSAFLSCPHSPFNSVLKLGDFFLKILYSHLYSSTSLHLLIYCNQNSVRAFFESSKKSWW